MSQMQLKLGLTERHLLWTRTQPPGLLLCQLKILECFRSAEDGADSTADSTAHVF